MYEAIKKEWLEALRSGEYEQGAGQLRNELDKYCCLGVLCEVAKKHGVGDWEKQGVNGGYSFLERDAYLPDALIKWADFPAETQQYKLTYLNDGDSRQSGASFFKIADYIEENL